MSVGFSYRLLALGALALIGVAGCGETRKSAATPETEHAPAVTAAPDPAAPAPGTQAAEAIGADSASDAAVIPPEKQPH